MPRKIYDPRLLTLTIQATTNVQVQPSLEHAPDTLVGALAPTAPGYPWDWADVTVSATWAGHDSSVTLKGRSYGNETAFLHSQDYQDAIIKCLSTLLSKLDRAADAVAKLGPRRVVQ